MLQENIKRLMVLRILRDNREMVLALESNLNLKHKCIFSN